MGLRIRTRFYHLVYLHFEPYLHGRQLAAQAARAAIATGWVVPDRNGFPKFISNAQ
jgi:hypothetical protein